MYEFIGSDARNVSSTGASATAMVLNSAPIFSTIFSYYESKTLSELGKVFFLKI